MLQPTVLGANGDRAGTGMEQGAGSRTWSTPGPPEEQLGPPGRWALGAGTGGTPPSGSWPGCCGSPLPPLNESCFCFASCLRAEVCKQEEALPVHPASGERGVEKMTAGSARAFTLLRTGGGREAGEGGLQKGRCLENFIFYFRRRKYSPPLPAIKGFLLSSTLKK